MDRDTYIIHPNRVGRDKWRITLAYRDGSFARIGTAASRAAAVMIARVMAGRARCVRLRIDWQPPEVRS
jgi:hypothetical protein